MAGKVQIDMNDAETWDDCQLKSTWEATWEDALQEYKARIIVQNLAETKLIVDEDQKYHSMAVNREKVQVEEEAEIDEEEPAAAETTIPPPQDAGQPNGNDGVASANPHAPANFTATDAPPTVTAGAPPPPQIGAALPPGLANLPKTLLSVQDENMKNIMMSWYYAGYYTGLYEGQQKAHAEMQDEGGAGG